MKRKLISYDAFKKIEEQSLTKAEEELIGAEDVLAKTLGLDGLTLFTFGENDVTYQAPNGSYVHANYKIEKEQLVLENIQQLVIEESDEKKNSRIFIANMVDAILEDNEIKASQNFDEYMKMPLVRRELSESFNATVAKPSIKGRKQNRSIVAKRIRARAKTLSRVPQEKTKLGGKRLRVYARKIKPATMKEWSVMCENVMGYVDYKEYGPVISQTNAKYDEKGNINTLTIPTIQKRNEGKILSFNWKTLDHEVKVLRGNVKKLHEDQNFIKAMADLKRYNNISDNTALEETLEAIVSRWPDVLYITEEELAKMIGTALETANVTNYDDSTCLFMAEAIMRTAHGAFTEKVKKISTLAGSDKNLSTECKNCTDAYKEFAEVAAKFYTELDESDNKDLLVFEDLFNALHEVYKISRESGDELTRSEVENFMSECQSILNRESKIDLDLAENIANYLRDLVESNLDGSDDNWNVSNNPHISVNGDNPKMNWAAKQTDATASKFNGDWNDEAAPVSDGKSYKGNSGEMKNQGWGNIGGEGVYPDLSNPYLPKAADFKMKEKSVVDDGDELGQKQGDTWPELNNPFSKKGEDFKMKSDNLVVEK